MIWKIAAVILIGLSLILSVIVARRQSFEWDRQSIAILAGATVTGGFVAFDPVSTFEISPLVVALAFAVLIAGSYLIGERHLSHR